MLSLNEGLHILGARIGLFSEPAKSVNRRCKVDVTRTQCLNSLEGGGEKSDPGTVMAASVMLAILRRGCVDAHRLVETRVVNDHLQARRLHISCLLVHPAENGKRGLVHIDVGPG